MGLVHPHGGQQPAVHLESESPPPESEAIGLPPEVHGLLAKIMEAASRGNYDQAIALSRRNDGQIPEIVNARGVCLLRQGKYQEAVTLFRNLTLQPGCTWMRKDRPVHHKTNFATALLLGGHPSGCLEILHELGQPGPPVAAKLRQAIRQWESTLGWGPWLDWKITGVEPSHAPVHLDFPPGDFGPDLPVEPGQRLATTLKRAS